jgi:hypothetical protein
MTDYRALCAELVEELEVWIGYGDEADCADAHAVVDRARAALAEQPVEPTTEFFPIPFDSRLPGPEDVNKDGYCWLWDNDGQMWRWIYIRTRTRAEMYDYTHWLSANALYIPEAP